MAPNVAPLLHAPRRPAVFNTAWWLWVGLFGWLTGALVGCVGGFQETRFLRCQTRPVDDERKSYELHDPFGDDRSGPSTQTRPRGFEVPRTDTRRDYDLRTMRSSLGASPLYSGVDPTGRPVPVDNYRPAPTARLLLPQAGCKSNRWRRRPARSLLRDAHFLLLGRHHCRCGGFLLQ